MKSGKILVAFAFMMLQLTAFVVTAQNNSTPYYIEDDEVIFIFDIRDYAEATRNGTAEQLDFSDLDIHRVAIAGEFNNWSKGGWKMKKKGEFTFQLRKKINQFDDLFPLDFKFVINEEYFAQPDVTYPKDRVFSNDFLEDTYNIKVHNVEPKADGNTFFFLEGHASARHVILTGDFIGWDENDLNMEKVPGGWGLRIDLPAGRYEYKFIADGDWQHDPQNPNYVVNEHQTLNSILQKTSTLAFTLEGHGSANQVMLAGSFNNWSQIPLVRTETAWKVELPIPGGKHRYKFVVDGKWILDPSNPIREHGHEEIEYSVLIMR